jgi:hypothetical protein
MTGPQILKKTAYTICHVLIVLLDFSQALIVIGPSLRFKHIHQSLITCQQVRNNPTFVCFQVLAHLILYLIYTRFNAFSIPPFEASNSEKNVLFRPQHLFLFEKCCKKWSLSAPPTIKWIHQGVPEGWPSSAKRVWREMGLPPLLPRKFWTCETLKMALGQS